MRKVWLDKGIKLLERRKMTKKIGGKNIIKDKGEKKHINDIISLQHIKAHQSLCISIRGAHLKIPWTEHQQDAKKLTLALRRFKR